MCDFQQLALVAYSGQLAHCIVWVYCDCSELFTIKQFAQEKTGLNETVPMVLRHGGNMFKWKKRKLSEDF